MCVISHIVCRFRGNIYFVEYVHFVLYARTRDEFKIPTLAQSYTFFVRDEDERTRQDIIKGENPLPGVNGKCPSNNRDQKAQKVNGARDTGDSENCGSEGI